MVDVAASGSGHRATVRIAPGGSAANAAAWAAAAGVDASVVGKVGDDAAGRFVRSELARLGVQAALGAGDGPTGAVLVLDDAGRRCVLAARGASAELGPDDLPRPLAADAALVSGYLLLHDDTLAAGRAALEATQARWLAVDAASAPLLRRRRAERFFHDVRGANVLLASDAEAREIVGSDGVDAVRRLGERFELACVKRGRLGGVAVLRGDEPLAMAPPTVADGAAVGTGDAFGGTLLAALARGEPLDGALREACAAGARAAAGAGWPERSTRRG